MSDKYPSQADRGFVSEQTVYGAVLKYDEAGSIKNESKEGPFLLGELSIRLDRASEIHRKVLSVSGGTAIHIDVTDKKYKIDPDDRTFKRTPGNDRGKVSELFLKDQQGEKPVIDIFAACDLDENSIFIITQVNPTCRYKLNQATGQWERYC